MGNKQGGRGVSGAKDDEKLSDEYDFIPEDHRLLDGLLKGRFEINKVLGSGTTARVVSITDPHTSKKYAMKQMVRKAKGNPKLFLRETNLLRKILHENIVRYHTSYVDQKYFYILVDFCSGGMLLDKIKEMDHFSEASAAKILCQILAAINFLHEHNIVHRDIKPENIVFSHPGDDATAILVDMGGAVQLDYGREYDDWVGSPAYMAPENLRPRQAEELKAADIWSIGVTGFQMMTGRFPFWGEDLMDLFRNIASAPIVFPSDSTLSDGAKGLLRSMLRRNTATRANARDACENEWLVNCSRHDETNHLYHWGDHLANYQDASRFKKLVVNYAVRFMDEEERQTLNQTFDTIDADGDGKIDEDELTKYLIGRGLEPDKAETTAHIWIEELDTTHEHNINRDEFVRAHWSEEIAHGDFLEMAFSKLDKNGDGKVSIDEVKAAIEGYISREISFEEAQAFLDEIDENGDGFISFLEFSNGMRALSSRHRTEFYHHES